MDFIKLDDDRDNDKDNNDEDEFNTAPNPAAEEWRVTEKGRIRPAVDAILEKA